MTMKAAVFHTPGQALRIESRPDPVPGAGEVVLKVGRCGICGSDLHMTDGHGYTVDPGSVLGHEFAGEIVAIGPGVNHLKVGDCVTALPLSGCGACAACLQDEPQWCAAGLVWKPGGYAEYAVAGARGCIKLPSALSLADGALVEPLAVALNAVKQARVQPGDKVIVIGPGPIGLATVYWARRFGAGAVVVASDSWLRADLARQMGATGYFVNDEQALEHCSRELGGLADIVFECVGARGLIARAVDLVRPRGTVLVAGYCAQPDTFVPAVAVTKQIRMQFAVLYSIGDFRTAVDALDAGAVEPRQMITETVSLEAFPEAFEALRKPSRQCKVMLAPWS